MPYPYDFYAATVMEIPGAASCFSGIRSEVTGGGESEDDEEDTESKIEVRPAEGIELRGDEVGPHSCECSPRAPVKRLCRTVYI